MLATNRIINAGAKAAFDKAAAEADILDRRVLTRSHIERTKSVSRLLSKESGIAEFYPTANTKRCIGGSRLPPRDHLISDGL